MLKIDKPENKRLFRAAPDLLDEHRQILTIATIGSLGHRTPEDMIEMFKEIKARSHTAITKATT